MLANQLIRLASEHIRAPETPGGQRQVRNSGQPDPNVAWNEVKRAKVEANDWASMKQTFRELETSVTSIITSTCVEYVQKTEVENKPCSRASLEPVLYCKLEPKGSGR